MSGKRRWEFEKKKSKEVSFLQNAEMAKYDPIPINLWLEAKFLKS